MKERLWYVTKNGVRQPGKFEATTASGAMTLFRKAWGPVTGTLAAQLAGPSGHARALIRDDTVLGMGVDDASALVDAKGHAALYGKDGDTTFYDAYYAGIEKVRNPARLPFGWHFADVDLDVYDRWAAGDVHLVRVERATGTVTASGRTPHRARSLRVLSALSKTELHELVADAVEVLWPGGDPDAEWTPETIEEVARVFIRAGLRPK